MVGAPALGAAERVPLVPCFEDYPACADLTGANSPGGGFVVFNDRNSSAGPNNLLVTVSLKKVTPNTAYDVYLFVDQTNVGANLGTVTTNGQGNANFQSFAALSLGAHDLGIDVTLEGSGNDVYLSDGFYSNPAMSATLTFE
jgi:hypothetical protein